MRIDTTKLDPSEALRRRIEAQRTAVGAEIFELLKVLSARRKRRTSPAEEAENARILRTILMLVDVGDNLRDIADDVWRALYQHETNELDRMEQAMSF